jgi:hypothetical protein
MDMFNTPHPPPKASRLDRFLLAIAGCDEDVLCKCPLRDWSAVRACAWIMICVWIYQASLLSLAGHQLFAAPGQFHPEIALGSIFLATFILCIDSFVIMRSGWHLSGIQELKRGGLDISGGLVARLKAGLFLLVRIVLLAGGMAQLTAIFVAMLIFASDINAPIQKSYLEANKHLIAPASSLVDAEIRRTTDAVKAQSESVNALALQVQELRQNQIDPSANNPQIRDAQQEVAQLVAQKAKGDEDVRTAETYAANEFGGIKGAPGNSGRPGYGLRYAAAMEQVKNAKAHAGDIANQLNAARTRLNALRQQHPAGNETVKRSSEQLPAFAEALNAENAKLTDLKGQLTALTANRASAIRKAVENAPDYVHADDGFLARLRVLQHLGQEDSMTKAWILLIDAVSFGFELAAVLAKVTSYVPTTYAALLARDAYMHAVRIVDAMNVELRAVDSQEHNQPETSPREKPRDDGDGVASSTSAPAGSNDPAAQPPKRGRGRPRKHPPRDPGPNRSTGQEGQEP